MKYLKALLMLPFRRTFWVVAGMFLLCFLIIAYGQTIEIAGFAPLSDLLIRWVVAGTILLLWLISIIVREFRKLKAEGVFRREIQPKAPEPSDPREDAATLINARFKTALEKLAASDRVPRTYLRRVPWYVFIGPPATGKTTALHQSGIRSVIDADNDLRGHGGTRNCDWFFTEKAVLIDTAGRYFEQESSSEQDANEWLGFLDLLKKHRGKRALNGVIVALSTRELTGSEADLHQHIQNVGRRLDEIRKRLDVELPVYLMITKLDLVPGFEEHFGRQLSDAARKQVWGTTFAVGERVEAAAVAREMRDLIRRVDRSTIARLGDVSDPVERAVLFRFPSALASLVRPISIVAEAIDRIGSGGSSLRLRGVYLTSATQEGSPIDRLTASLAADFGLAVPAAPVVPPRQKRSFFLHDLLDTVVFREAGLAVQSLASIRRRRLIATGALGATAVASVLLAVVFTVNYFAGRRMIERQAEAYLALVSQLSAGVVPEVVSDKSPDIALALAAVGKVDAARVTSDGWGLSAFGPRADGALGRVQDNAFHRALTYTLEPRMVAVLENAMWENMDNPSFQLEALKTYKHLTRTAPSDTERSADWWLTALPGFTDIEFASTDSASSVQRQVFEQLVRNTSGVPPSETLIEVSEKQICDNISIAELALDDLLERAEAMNLEPWIPRLNAKGNPDLVFSRYSPETLRQGIPGAFTRDGFQKAILPLLDDVVATYSAESAFFLSRCAESAATSPEELRSQVLERYSQRFISAWTYLLRDLRLSPLPQDDLRRAVVVLEEVSSPNGALITLLQNVAYSTDLTLEENAGGGAAVPKGLLKLPCKVVKWLCKAQTVLPKNKNAGSAADAPEGDGARVTAYFLPMRGIVKEVDGNPPTIDEVVLAMEQLKIQLQTAVNSDDANRTLDEMGGLQLLTGALAGSGETLPDPVDKWIIGLANDVSNGVTDAIIERINATWQKDVLPKCRLFTEGQFPFDPGSSTDMTIQDFATLFGPGGLIDSFVKDELANYIDETTWQWRAGMDRENAPLGSLAAALRIRDTLFPDGTGPIMRFLLSPVEMIETAQSATLSIDGEAFTYRHAATDPKSFTWPGLNRTDVISLSFLDSGGQTLATKRIEGEWAFLRLVKPGLSKTSQPGLFRLRLDEGEYWILYELRARSALNPFDLTVFEDFSCPKQF